MLRESIAYAVLAAVAAAPVRADFGVAVKTITSDLVEPTHVVVAPGDPERLFVAERAGRIRVVKNGVLLATPFLDITALVNSLPPERALAAMAFHPNYQANGLFYVTYTDQNAASVLARFQVTGDPDVADPASLTILKSVPQPCATHNLGWIGFGPDGYLYVAAGDGGNCTGGVFAQDLSSLQGKIWRIDVDGPGPYRIPGDNPFVGRPGADEIWALGLRNPWRCSFDRLTNDFWIADVGQGQREEVNFQPAGSAGGANYGWNCMEGSICYPAGTGCTCNDGALTDPVHDYAHTAGCAVIGGFVYRGSALAELAGLYIFGDVCTGDIRAMDRTTYEVTPVINVSNVYSFGEDHDGELYFTSTFGLRKLVIIDCNGNGVPDDQDIADLTSADCNSDGVPDECQQDCNGNGAPDDCDVASGFSPDDNGNGIPDECDELADFDGDGFVNVTDLLILLGAWGPCLLPPDPCVADVNGDGDVGVVDLLEVLASWDA